MGVAGASGAHPVSPAHASARRRRERAPGPPGEPLLGSLRRLQADPLGLFTEGAAEYGDLVEYRAAYKRVFLVAGPDLIAHIAVANRDNYTKGVSYDALKVPIGDSLLTADGPEAQARRKLLMPLFTRRWLLDELPTMVAAVESHFDRWDSLAARGEPFNVVSEMNRLAFDVVGRVLIGAALADSMTWLEKLIDDASDWVARRTRALVPLPPVLPTARNRAYRRAEREIRAFTEELIERKRGGAETSDVLSRLMAVRDSHGLPMGAREVRDEIIGLMMAGHQTTGAGLAWTWYLLGRHPEVERRAANETLDALAGDAPTADSLDRLTYLQQVIDESMRLYPPGWAFTRTPIEDDELGGYRIPKGSVVVICSYANQRNPRLWPAPLEFDPDRFAPERPSPEPYSHFPFGAGPHSCIGKHLALIESRVAMAMLLARYRLEPVSDREVAATPGITLTPAAPIMVRATRR